MNGEVRKDAQQLMVPFHSAFSKLFLLVLLAHHQDSLTLLCQKKDRRGVVGTLVRPTLKSCKL